MSETVFLGLIRCAVVVTIATIFFRQVIANYGMSAKSQRFAWITVLLIGCLPFSFTIPIPDHWIPKTAQLARATDVAENPGIAKPTQTTDSSPVMEQASAEFSSAEFPTAKRSTEASGEFSPQVLLGAQTQAFTLTTQNQSLLPSLPSIALSIWLMGVTALISRSIWSQVCFLRETQFRDARDESWREQFDSLAHEFGLTRRLRFFVTNSTGPCICYRRFSTTVLVPEGLWQNLEPCERESILRHELAHLSNRDLILLPLARLAFVIQWFNPMAWIALRSFHHACETRADEIAANSIENGRATLASVLLRLADVQPNANQSATHSLQPAASGDGNFATRIRHILTSDFKEDSLMKRGITIAALASLLCLCVMRPVATGQEPTDGSSAPAAATGDDANSSQVAENESKTTGDLPADNSPADNGSPTNDGSPPACLPNVGFEMTDSKGKVSGWHPTRVPRNQGHYIIQRDSSIAHSGKYSVSISISSDHPSSSPVAYNWVTNLAHFKTETDYKLTGWIKTQSAVHSPSIITQCWKDKKIIGYGTTAVETLFEGDQDWTKVGYRFRIPKGTEQVLVRAVCSNQNKGGTVWFDDVTVEADPQDEPAPVLPAKVVASMDEYKNRHPRWDELDGSFEQVKGGDNDQLVQWRAAQPPTDSGVVLGRTSEHSVADDHSVSIEIKDSDPKKSYGHWYASVRELEPGTVYRISVSTKSQDVRAEPQIGVHLRRNPRATANSLTLINPDGAALGTKDWTKWSGQFLVPPKATHAAIFLHLPAKNNLGAKVWFDDVKIEAVKTI